MREPGERATQLLECLRTKADVYGVGIEAGTDGELRVSDQGGYVTDDDLSAFLRAQLDECAKGRDWTSYLFVSEP